MRYLAKILDDGQIVLPAEFGREIGFRDGDSLFVERDGTEFVIRIEVAAANAQERLSRVLQGYSVADFVKDRAADWRE